MKNMKKISSILSVLLALLCALSCLTLAACQKPEDTDALWANARYTADTALGSGSKTVQVEVKTDNKSITFTLHTDKANLEEALLEHGLIDGDRSEFGLYIKQVNGITADYDIDQTYWKLTKNGELMMTGASAVTIADGEHYEFTKASS